MLYLYSNIEMERHGFCIQILMSLASCILPNQQRKACEYMWLHHMDFLLGPSTALDLYN